METRNHCESLLFCIFFCLFGRRLPSLSFTDTQCDYWCAAAGAAVAWAPSMFQRKIFTPQNRANAVNKFRCRYFSSELTNFNWALFNLTKPQERAFALNLNKIWHLETHTLIAMFKVYVLTASTKWLCDFTWQSRWATETAVCQFSRCAVRVCECVCDSSAKVTVLLRTLTAFQIRYFLPFEKDETFERNYYFHVRNYGAAEEDSIRVWQVVIHVVPFALWIIKLKWMPCRN